MAALSRARQLRERGLMVAKIATALGANKRTKVLESQSRYGITVAELRIEKLDLGTAEQPRAALFLSRLFRKGKWRYIG